jgi:hypothetical protein
LRVEVTVIGLPAWTSPIVTQWCVTGMETIPPCRPLGLAPKSVQPVGAVAVQLPRQWTVVSRAVLVVSAMLSASNAKDNRAKRVRRRMRSPFT